MANDNVINFSRPLSALLIFPILLMIMGCARVSIDTKKPIELDVKMRVDIYQHVAKDADDIENMVSSEPKAQPGPLSRLFGVTDAFAAEEDSYPKEVREAIERRKDRKEELLKWEARARLGENNMGKVEVRDPAVADKGIFLLVDEENRDRDIIYSYVAEKNGASVDETAKIFADRIQADAPSGTPVQAEAGEWTVK